MVTTTAMIITVACGIALAVFYTYFIKKVLGGFLRDLSEKNVLSPESALSLSQLDYGKVRARAVYIFLSENSTLRRFVGISEDEKAGIDTQKYYLLPEKKEDALRRYKDNGQNALSLVICMVALIVATIIFIAVAPYVEDFIDNIPNSFKNETPHIEGVVDDGIETITPEEIEKRYEEELKKQEAEKKPAEEESEENESDSIAESESASEQSEQ